MHNNHGTQIILAARRRRRRAGTDARQAQEVSCAGAWVPSRRRPPSPDVERGLDAVDLCSRDSFPASDAPGWIH
jgi:hypothetical protein